MREIRILDKTYQVPSFGRDRFLGLQDRFRSYQKEIARFSRPRSFLGLGHRGSRAVSVQHWLQVMDGIIDNYEGAMEELRRDIDDYHELFKALSLDVRDAFRRKAAELSEMEGERERLARRAREQADEDLFISLEVDRKQKLQEMTLNLMTSTILLLRKIQVSWAAVSRLAADRSQQREVLGELSSQLRLYRDVLRFDRRMKQLQVEVARFARIALRFDRIIAENIGPLHSLISEVASVDEHIAHSLNEMERLRIELSAVPGKLQAPLGYALKEVLRHLVLSRVSQELFEDAFRQVAEQDSAAEELEYRSLEAEDDLMVSIGNASRLVERHVDLLLGGEEGRGGAHGGAGTEPTAPAHARRRLRVELRQVLVTTGLLSAAPCVHGGAVYLGDEGGCLYCLDAGDGTVRWRTVLPAGIHATAAAMGDSCLVGSRSGEVYCLEAASGDIRWTFPTSGRVEAAPVVRPDRAFVGSLDGMMYCLRVEDGSPCWRFAAGAAIVSEAVLGDPSLRPGLLYFAGSDGRLFGVGSEEGEQVLAVQADTAVVGTPVVAAGNVVFAGEDGALYALREGSGETAWTLRLAGQRLLPPVVFREPTSGRPGLVVQASESFLHIVSAALGSIVSTVDIGASQPQFPPSVQGGIACAQRSPGSLTLVDLQSATVLCSADVTEGALLRPVLSEDTLVAADRMGRVYLGAYQPPELAAG